MSLRSLFKRKNVIAREALGIVGAGIGGQPVYDPRKPEDQAHDAVAAALDLTNAYIEAAPGGGHRIVTKVENLVLPPVGPEPYVMPAELSPEYHAGLASRMMDRTDADARRLADAIASERKQHKLTMTALYAELAGLKRVRKAYKAAGAMLQPVEPAPEPSNETPCPPYEECSANGAGGHSFNSHGPDGVTVQCDYCGKSAPEQFQAPKPLPGDDLAIAPVGAKPVKRRRTKAPAPVRNEPSTE